MSYCVTQLIAIMHDEELNKDDYINIIYDIANAVDKENYVPVELLDKTLIDKCLSTPVCAMKGGYIIIGGVFNGWRYEASSQFVGALAKCLDANIHHFCNEEDYQPVHDWWYGNELQQEINDMRPPDWTINPNRRQR